MNTIPVFYEECMLADQAGSTLSPSSSKPRFVLQSWIEQEYPIEIRPIEPVSVEDLSRAHAPSFVRRVLACERDNGFSNRLPQVAASLPYTSGAMLCAAKEALANGAVAVAPTSGFHHAGYNSAEGFCTFNGLMVAALALRAVPGQWNLRIGILDIDQHYGNGTDDILGRMWSAERDLTPHYTVGAARYQSRDAVAWLNVLPDLVDEMFGDCDLVLYQAGADPHVDDPFGGFLTTEQLHERDQIVFRVLHARRVPVAWNLAGGYQSPLRKVLDIHDNTMQACVREFLAT